MQLIPSVACCEEMLRPWQCTCSSFPDVDQLHAEQQGGPRRLQVQASGSAPDLNALAAAARSSDGYPVSEPSSPMVCTAFRFTKSPSVIEVSLPWHHVSSSSPPEAEPVVCLQIMKRGQHACLTVVLNRCFGHMMSETCWARLSSGVSVSVMLSGNQTRRCCHAGILALPHCCMVLRQVLALYCNLCHLACTHKQALHVAGEAGLACLQEQLCPSVQNHLPEHLQ